jgi:lipoprotein NlpI
MKPIVAPWGVVGLSAILLFTSCSRSDDAADQFVAQSSQAFESGDVAGAFSQADKAIAANPKEPRYRIHRAALHDALRQWEQAVADYDAALNLAPSPQVQAAIAQRRGSDHFRLGHIEQSIKDFDRFLELQPEEAAGHWQRGISLYYAGRFDDGRKQFELHKTVNPDDVENAAWHFLCAARAQGVEKARESLLKIDLNADRRVPMREIYDLFAGKTTPEVVLAAAENHDAEHLKHQRMYAHLYVGLYYEVTGKPDLARQHLELAAGEYSTNDYMGDVAKVHAAMIRASASAQDGKSPKK